MLGFASDVCHADALSDLILGNKAATPLPVSPVKAPGGTAPITSITLPYAQTKPVPAVQSYVDAEVVELTMKSGSQSTYAQDIANKVAETTVWEAFGKGLEKLAGSKMLGLLGNVLEGVKEVGGTPTHGTILVPERWGDKKVQGRATTVVGERFSVLCVSAPGSNASALASEIRIERLSETIAGGSEWVTSQRVVLRANLKGVGRYVLIPRWTGTFDKAGVHRVKCHRNVFADQVKAFEVHVVERRPIAGFGTLDATELLPHYFGGRYRNVGCKTRSPCIEPGPSDKGRTRYPDLSGTGVIEASIDHVEALGDQSVVIFEVADPQAGCHPCAPHWEYLRLVKLNGRWQEVFHGYGSAQVSGSFGRLSSRFRPVFWKGKPIGVIVESGFSSMGVSMNSLRFYREFNSKLSEILSETFTDGVDATPDATAKGYFEFTGDVSSGLPDILLFNPDRDGPRRGSVKYRFNGHKYLEVVSPQSTLPTPAGGSNPLLGMWGQFRSPEQATNCDTSWNEIFEFTENAIRIYDGSFRGTERSVMRVSRYQVIGGTIRAYVKMDGEDGFLEYEVKGNTARGIRGCKERPKQECINLAKKSAPVLRCRPGKGHLGKQDRYIN